MLVDDVTITVLAGNGGNGAVSFRRNTVSAIGPPDGGNGGDGGDISVQGSSNINDLREFRFKKTIEAGHGGNGTKHNGFGKNAEASIIRVPLGTEIIDTQSGWRTEITDTVRVVLLARGGRGGKGNAFFKSSTNRSPSIAEPGGVGQERTIQLKLRLIADIGLIGLPNAGKSSLLAVLTNAKPAIGAYPFTTLEPNIGMIGARPIADIPGLIEGASQGKGLGAKFLAHIEKTKVLVHCIDGTSADPLGDYLTIRHELEQHSPELIAKLEIIFVNKTDLMDAASITRVKRLLSKGNKKVLSGSAMDSTTLTALKRTLSAV